MTSTEPRDSQEPPAGRGRAEQAVQAKELESLDLLQGARSVAIRHAGEIYRLILTRNNRLILQK